MNFAKTALDLFYKTFGRRILKTAADNKWVTNMIQKLKSKAASTQKTADKVREKMLKDKPFQGFTPKIVPKKPTTLGDALKTGKHTKVPTPSHLKPPSIKKSNVIPFPKKPPTLKADGGRIDKALPKKSRDI